MTDRTVQLLLKKEGLQYVVNEQVDLLSEAQIQKRLNFAEARVNDNWEYVLFTDEKTFQLGSVPHKSWQNPKKRKRHEKKRHAPKVHVWGGIGSHFKTRLYFFHETLDANLYCRILKSKLPPGFTYDLPSHAASKWIFVQDNDPRHRSAKPINLLNKIGPDHLSDFPPNSPDFNILEDIWSLIAAALEHQTIKTMAELKRAIRKEWKNWICKLFATPCKVCQSDSKSASSSRERGLTIDYLQQLKMFNSSPVGFIST